MVVVLRAVQPIFFNCWGYPAHFQVAAQLHSPTLALRLSSRGLQVFVFCPLLTAGFTTVILRAEMLGQGETQI